MSKSRPRGMAPWRPQARSRVLLEQVQAILARYAEQLPLTIRQMFYLLVAGYDYDKTENAYERLGELLNRARRARQIPFEVIRDDGIIKGGPIAFSGRTAFWNWVRRRARGAQLAERMVGQPVAIEVWCEATGMVPQLERVAEPYGIRVYACPGFDSVTFKYQAAVRALARTVPTVILHLGDHDPSGQSLFNNLVEDVGKFVEDLGGPLGWVRFQRVAVTQQQIEDYHLPTAPPKPTDRRGRWEGGTVQCEALPPDVLADELRAAIEALIDRQIMDQVLEAERDERDEVLADLAWLRQHRL